MLQDFNIALSEVLEQKLISNPKNRFIIGRIAKSLTQCYLEGEYSNGLRVKKLKNSNRTIFEARLNKADRLLFTVCATHRINCDK